MRDIMPKRIEAGLPNVGPFVEIAIMVEKSGTEQPTIFQPPTGS
jgi:hypothetical protein